MGERSPFDGLLNNPQLNTVRFLQFINQQFQFNLGNILIGGSGDNPQFSAVNTYNRRGAQFKPFIIGFIPPDNEVNFIPVVKSAVQLGDLPNSNPPTASSGTCTPPLIRGGQGVPNEGLIPQRYTGFEGDRIRELIREKYREFTGQEPAEGTIRNMWSHIRAEGGRYNYNFGNMERGRRGPGIGAINPQYDTLAKIDAAIAAGELNDRYDTRIIASPPPNPESGTYWLGVGYTANNIPYPTYYSGFSNLSDAVGYYVTIILRQWPNAGCATTVEGFSKGLKEGAAYHVMDEERYRPKLESQAQVYDRNYGNSPIGAQPAPPVPPPPPDDPTSASQGPTPGSTTVWGRNLGGQGAIVSSNAINDQLENPLNGAWGTNLIPDEARFAVVENQTNALRRQIEFIKNTPPLVLYINPTDLSIKHENSINMPKGRNRHIVHHWLEKPMTITANGLTGGMYTVSSDTGFGGLTSQFRVFSLSYQNLLSLLNIYKSNGIIRAGVEAEKGIPILGFTIYIYYDNHVYLGSFDNFSIEDDESSPFQLKYSFGFTVRYDLSTILDRSSPSDFLSTTTDPVSSTSTSTSSPNPSQPEAPSDSSFGLGDFNITIGNIA